MKGRDSETLVVAIANQKGGVAKTTTAVNLAACLADSGRETLLVDMDPQANASLGLGLNVYGLEASMYDVMLGLVPLGSTIQPTMLERLRVAPAHLNMSSLDIRLASELDKPFLLRHALAPVRDQYDWILIDCPPALNTCTLTSLVAATHLVIPIEPKYYALAGMAELNRTVANIKKKLEHGLDLLGVLITMYDERTNVHRTVGEEIDQYFGRKVFKTKIRTNITLSKAELEKRPVILSDPHSHGAEDYRALLAEIEERIHGRARAAALSA